MKSIHHFYFISSILILLFSCQPELEKGSEPIVQKETQVRIAFGSCAHSYDTLKIFDAINNIEPDIWIWLGDIVYGDTHDMAVLKEKYDKQKSKPEYQRLLAQSKVIGTWDDHDYGVNDAGKFHSMKEESKEELLRFLEVPASDSVRFRDGVYSDYAVRVDDKLIKILMLDTRYFRDTLWADTVTLARHLPNFDGDILGEGQWQWLESQLSINSVDLYIIGSSIQLIAEEQGFEKWANFPAARNRFFNMLKNTGDTPVIIISGDRHMAEMSRIDLEYIPYPLYDLTASGLTHTWGMYREEPNQYRQGELIVSKNFGLLDIKFTDQQPHVDTKVINEEGKVLLKQSLHY